MPTGVLSVSLRNGITSPKGDTDLSKDDILVGNRAVVDVSHGCHWCNSIDYPGRLIDHHNDSAGSVAGNCRWGRLSSNKWNDAVGWGIGRTEELNQRSESDNT